MCRDVSCHILVAYFPSAGQGDASSQIVSARMYQEGWRLESRLGHISTIFFRQFQLNFVLAQGLAFPWILS